MDIIQLLPNNALQEVLCFKEYLFSKPEEGRSSSENNGQRRAAVLVPLIWQNNQWEILFTRRSKHVQDHKGQVSFPGGMTEKDDHDIVATAMREAKEEINLDPEDVHIIGFLADCETNSNYRITPVVAVIRNSKKIKACTDEVDTIFTIPMTFLEDERNHSVQVWKRSDGENVPVLFYSEYQGELLWGITARITNDLLTIIKK
jgi:8-oxo-dGTP pyrophosphatase MutT (NUDIX family)